MRSLPALARPGEDPPEYARTKVEVAPEEAQGSSEVLTRDSPSFRYDFALDVDALDIVVYSPSNQPLVAVEAKQSSKLLERMLAEIGTLQRHGLELRWNALPLSNARRNTVVYSRFAPSLLSSRSWDLTGLCGALPRRPRSPNSRANLDRRNPRRD